MRATETRPLFLVAYAAFVGVALEGLIVDTDHWRHFYLLMAIIWGLMSASHVVQSMPAAMPKRRHPRAAALPSRPIRPAMRRRSREPAIEAPGSV
jgi:hypothetical protein